MPASHHLAAILFTDIVGYTAVMQHDEEQARVIIKRHNSVLEKTVAAHHGEVVNYYGDGSLCIFSSAIGSVRCAMEIQKELQNEPVVPLRIGLHVGEVSFEDGKALGDGVNIASRIQSLGQANTILFSKEIFDKIRNQPEFKAVSLGHFDFKHVDDSVEVFALTNEGLTVPRKEQISGKLKEHAPGKTGIAASKKWLIVIAILVILSVTLFFVMKKFRNDESSNNAKKENSLAVLYFTNMSGDPSQEYFSDGITEEIITRLSAINGLKVKSRTSVLQYKDEKKSTKQIANELGVNNILEGSLRKQGNKIRVTAQLIDATTDDHIWSVDYDRELKDIFEVQSDIAQHIAEKFEIILSSDTKRKLETAPTTNTEAYDLYLKARSLSFLTVGLGGEQTDTRKAIGLLKHAIQLDPTFSDAYALLSLNYSNYSGDAKDPKHWLDSALLLAQKAIQLNPDRVFGYNALGSVYQLQGNLDEALKWLFKAHDLVPFSTIGNIMNIYEEKKEYGNAMEWIMKAIAYDPAEPANYVNKASIFYNLGLLDSMKNYLDLARDIQPELFDAGGAGSEYYLVTGNYEAYDRLERIRFANNEKEYNFQLGVFYEMRRDWKKEDSLLAISSHPDDMSAGLAKIHLGNEEQGRLFMQRAIDRRKHFEGFNNSWHYYDISRQYAALEDDRYIEYFEKAIQKGWHSYSFFEHDPFFDFVKDKPEFKKLKQEVYENNVKYKQDMYAAMKTFYKENRN